MQVQMPRMSKEELHEVLDKRLELIDMEIELRVREKIALLSQGLPSFTHLLALSASQRSIERNSTCIEELDLQVAIEKAVEKAYQSIISSYHLGYL